MPDQVLKAPPKLQIEYVSIRSLKLDSDNSREHGSRQIRQIARSVEAFEFNAPILVDRDGKVVAGNGRLMALQQLGRTEVPIVRLEHLSPEQARAYAIADNRLTDVSRFNDKQLALNLKLLSDMALDFDLEATGFSMGEIDLRIESLTFDEPDAAIRDDDEAPIEAGVAVTHVGDLWRLGDHRLYCGSALEASSFARLLLARERIDAVFMDAPYNVPIDGHVSGKGKRRHREFVQGAGEMEEGAFIKFLQASLEAAVVHLRPGAVVFSCMDWRHVGELMTAAQAAGLTMINLCVWTKPIGGMGSLYRSAHELVLVFRHGKTTHRNNVELGRHGRNRTNVWAYPGANQFLRSSEDADLIGQHPTPKPVKMVADALLDVTARGDLVLDPFMGGGSTLMAAERIGRRARGIELDPLYVDLTIRRWMRMTGEDAVHEATGERFSVLEAKTEEAAR